MDITHFFASFVRKASPDLVAAILFSIRIEASIWAVFSLGRCGGTLQEQAPSLYPRASGMWHDSHLQRLLCQRSSSGTGGTLAVDQSFSVSIILLKWMLPVSTWYMRIFSLALYCLNEYNFREILQRSLQEVGVEGEMRCR